MSLSNAAVCAFIATTDAVKARAFYAETLGLRLVEESPYALVFDANGTMLRVQKVAALTPAPYTALGWNVADIRSEVAALETKGVHVERYSFVPQDEHGIWTTPDGAQIAWFRDPDGNTLSLAQHPVRANPAL